MKVKEEIIINEAKVFLNGNMTVQETAETLGISKRTLQIHMKKLKNIDENIYNLVEEKKQANQEQGRIVGGQVGKATPRYTKEEAIRVANIMLSESLTYREAETLLEIPRTTIYEMIHSEYVEPVIKDKLDILAMQNVLHTTEIQQKKRRK